MIESLDISELTPHATPMLLLDSYLDAGDDYLVSQLTVRDDDLFDEDGSVPAYLGLEYMAQTIAAFSGYQAHLRGDAVKLGFLLGTRRFNTNVSRMPCGENLTVTVNRAVQGESGLAAFECSVIGGGIEQTATLSVYEPADTQDYLQGKSNV